MSLVKIASESLKAADFKAPYWSPGYNLYGQDIMKRTGIQDPSQLFAGNTALGKQLRSTDDQYMKLMKGGLGTGAGVGGALGLGLGSLVGHPILGTLGGAALGAIGGGLLGHSAGADLFKNFGAAPTK